MEKLEETLYQMEYQKYYRILLPEHQYLKSFLLARLGEKTLARSAVSHWYSIPLEISHTVHPDNCIHKDNCPTSGYRSIPR